MSNMNFITKLLVAVIPIVLLSWWNSKVNLKKEVRSRQFLMLPVAVIYGIVTSIFFFKIYITLTYLVRQISGWIANISEFLAKVIDDFLKSINLNFWMIFIANIIIFFVFIILKTFLCKILKRVFSNKNRLHSFVIKPFYEYDSEKDVWCIKNKFGQTRTFFKTFYIASVILSCVMFLVSMYVILTGLVKSPFYPTLTIIVIGEVYFFLDGYIRSEYLNEFLGEDEDANSVVNYSLMRKVLRKLFPDKLSTDNTVVNNPIASVVTNDEVINKMLISDDDNIVVFGTFVRAICDKGYNIDQNYVCSTVELLKGKSVLFNTPFYNDLMPYVFFAMQKTLLRHKKVLVILGRHGIEDEIIDWFSRGIASITNIEELWNTGVLGENKNDYDVGILTRSAVHDIKVHDANADFFKDVEFVMLIEPSKILSTAQIGINSVVKACRKDSKQISFCSCDKNCDGLIDALSHVLMTDIIEVSATNKQDGVVSYMCWDADDEYLQHRMMPNISRYLGVGTELSFVALKNQISKTYWYGGEAYPVVDQNWINKQYYYDLLKYAGLPTKQEEFDTVFKVSPSYWSATVTENAYMTVEDESNNLFEVIRDFSTRASEQGFVNVVSQDYLLKDYMTYNASLFEADAKAIPYIVADYARTDRNVTMCLLLRLSSSFVKKDDIIKEFSLVGKKVADVKKVLWYEISRCYASVEDEIEFDNVLGRLIDEFSSDIILSKDKFNIETGKIETLYYIRDEKFIATKIEDLKNAAYISEDEKGNTYYLGSELLGHVFQKFLPGQFFTFDGKYYEMAGLTADNQVLMRRAADHIFGREVTRQIRYYTINATKPLSEMGSQKNIGGIKINYEFADYEVQTYSYLRMKTYGDFASAKTVEINGIPKRTYKNKEILKISMDNISTEVRTTVVFMLNEIFRSLFAENQAYIVALTNLEDFDNKFIPITCQLNFSKEDSNKNSIYIVEDSQLDLGLIKAVDRNLRRIFEIMCDWINWHGETLELSLNPPVEQPIVVDLPEDTDEQGNKKKKGLFKRIIDKIKSLFKRKKKIEDSQEVPQNDDVQTQTEQPSVEDTQTAVYESVPVEDASHRVEETHNTAGENIEPEQQIEISGEDEVSTVPKPQTEGFVRKSYHERHYLLFGGVDCELINIEETLDFLTSNGFGNNSLEQARSGLDVAEKIEKEFDSDKADVHYCDFCGVELVGTEYEVLADGRERCMICGRTAVKTTEEFTKIFRNALRNMEAFFGIRISASIKVKMVTSRELARHTKSTFIPTNGFDSRAVGVAIKDSSGYTICIENGTPRISAMMTIVHELTHIWQYLNWNQKELVNIYGKDKLLEVYEGMAKWVEIQYAYLINEKAIAKREELITLHRNDEYGRGFVMYLNKYSFSKGTYVSKPTPFLFKDRPL